MAAVAFLTPTVDKCTFSFDHTFVKAHMPLGNYFVDKGWLSAIEHFADCIMDGNLKQAAAGAFDGLQAARITEAAIASRGTGKVVCLK